jgi:hypothetical protein
MSKSKLSKEDKEKLDGNLWEKYFPTLRKHYDGLDQDAKDKFIETYTDLSLKAIEENKDQTDK